MPVAISDGGGGGNGALALGVSLKVCVVNSRAVARFGLGRVVFPVSLSVLSTHGYLASLLK